jgi:hypothetical protein
MARQTGSTTSGGRRGRGGAPTASDVVASHRDWLAAVSTDGPFLSAPVLRQRWPQGMPRLGDLERSLLTDELRRSRRLGALGPHPQRRHAGGYRQARDTFAGGVLREVVGWGDLLVDGERASSLPRTAPSRCARDPGDGERGALLLVVDLLDSLRNSRVTGGPPVRWTAEALLSAGVRIGVVTDGRWWALCTWCYALPARGRRPGLRAEARTRDAWMTLLEPGARARRPGDRLPELFVA